MPCLLIRFQFSGRVLDRTNRLYIFLFLLLLIPHTTLSSLQDDLINFQKKAIFRQMSEYKRLFDQSQQTCAELHVKQRQYHSNITMVIQYLTQIMEELSLVKMRMAKEVDNFGSNNNESVLLIQAFLDHSSTSIDPSTVDTSLRESCEKVKSMLDSIMKSVLQSRNGNCFYCSNPS